MPTDLEEPGISFAESKGRQSVNWGDGPYERISDTLRDVHALVIERVDPVPGLTLLDVATGTGAVALLAAERGADTTGVDLAPALVETARDLAAERGLDVTFEVGDAEDMPYADGSFDIVTSTFGVMFAPDPRAGARELIRVTRPGGRIALAAWRPESDMLRMMAPFVPLPPPGVGNPYDWGREEYVRDLLGSAFELEFEEHVSPLVVESGEACWELFTTSYGPTKAIVRSLDPDRRAAFRRAWIDFFEDRRQGDDVVHEREYLLTIGARR